MHRNFSRKYNWEKSASFNTSDITTFKGQMIQIQSPGSNNNFQKNYTNLLVTSLDGYCRDMIAQETAIHQTTVEFKLLQVPLWPSTMDQSPYYNGSCKRPRNTN